ncbi:MAG TPA: hypothetical protein VI365_28040 [Trebonia sp.]
MSTQPAITMKELELEHAELLPSRETLCVSKCHPSYSSSFNFAQVGGSTYQSGIGNVALLNGDNLAIVL